VQSIPVMLGYLFIGLAFGLMLQNVGFHYGWALLSSVVIYGGSIQFLLVSFLSSGAGLLYCFAMTLFINGRHIFYGLSFLEKFRTMGKAYPYMIFSLTDETYSLLCSLKVPEGYREKKVAFWIALFDHSDWVFGSVAGALLGQALTFDSKGVDFSMTALFVVIVLNQWMDSTDHSPTWIGLIVGVAFLLLLGAEQFLLPSLFCVMFILILKRELEQRRKRL
jgi:4-azaleucine resistance transporter AzlC